MRETCGIGQERLSRLQGDGMRAPRPGAPHRQVHHSLLYTLYLRSPAWQAKRQQVIARAGGRWARCGMVARLDVHHLTYARLTDEPLEDLQALCRPCHDVADAERKARQRAMEARP
jgi:5-methylcytosine-specific restriction endonuclease McrA